MTIFSNKAGAVIVGVMYLMIFIEGWYFVAHSMQAHINEIIQDHDEHDCLEEFPRSWEFIKMSTNSEHLSRKHVVRRNDYHFIYNQHFYCFPFGFIPVRLLPDFWSIWRYQILFIPLNT